MSKIEWGVFQDGRDMHVIPVVDEVMMKGHTATSQCACGPAIDYNTRYNNKIWIHEIFQ